ncbi:GNAT family N-acetyltransferase [Candidatus Oleimmundimicrobium sp.]|uniref:GNAT family N-acetyltransferase n=1 Tax=Candidatus Oleimmundimicrobium sp. TaxID=3060597 RepID=UPI00272086F6|nr:GNAT family N-acetyltransferase [Candidatus Oleimmundimicrobium sp.]MDO8885840.1 GNAT family N-acetyltransferase [Candidatus Oleimmundimicrobium sp.]
MEVKVVKKVDFNLIKKLVFLEKEAFGQGGLDEWTLPVFIRYGKVYILEEDGKIEGLAEFIRDWNEIKRVFLVSFSICQDKRGKGLGKFFLTKIIELLREEGLKEVKTTVSPVNEAALNLYEKLGFVRTDYLKNEYGPGNNRLLMKLSFGED